MKAGNEMADETRETSGVERAAVSLAGRSYDILVGAGLMAHAGALIRPLMAQPRAVIVTDRNVAALHLPALERSLDAAGIVHHAVVLPPGEETKTIAHFARLADDVLAAGIERGSMLVALGGGVVGDLAGFAAATLLSSVGGKTGIDTRQGKNLIGAFPQPRLVLADGDTLATLPARELAAGYAEIVKYGLIRDRDFFAWLETSGAALLAGNAAARCHAVVASCRAKAAIVTADERESGERELLNLGHTFGHAMEAATGFGNALLHGEAVAIGMVLAFDFAARRGLCPPEDAARLRRHLAATGLPTAIPRPNGKPLSADALLAAMGKDKKVRQGRIALVLPRRIGEAFVTRDVPAEAIGAFLAESVAAG